MNWLWLIRMYKWAKNPPGGRQLVIIFGLLLLFLAVFLTEQFFGWPEVLTPGASMRRGGINY